MNLKKLSRWFVGVILFAACVALILLMQAQLGGGEAEPNKCHTDWDFCNDGSAAENAYHWRLGWCVAAVERGAVPVSVSTCMGEEGDSVSSPRSSSPPSAFTDENKCYAEWDFCNAGTEAENAYFWRLGWCTAGFERGVLSGSLDQCMRGEQSTGGAPRPDETQDDPWSREICWAMGLGRQCGWDATLPPGMECAVRDDNPPYDCIRHAPLSGNALTSTAAAGG